MRLGLALADLPASVLALWESCAQLVAGRSPCTKLLLFSVVLFALAIALRALLHHVSTTHRLPTSCELTDAGAKTP